MAWICMIVGLLLLRGFGWDLVLRVLAEFVAWVIRESWTPRR